MYRGRYEITLQKDIYNCTPAILRSLIDMKNHIVVETDVKKVCLRFRTDLIKLAKSLNFSIFGQYEMN